MKKAKNKKDFVILNASVLVKSLTLRRVGFAGSFRLSYFEHDKREKLTGDAETKRTDGTCED